MSVVSSWNGSGQEGRLRFYFTPCLWHALSLGLGTSSGPWFVSLYNVMYGLEDF